MSWDPDQYLRFADHRTRPGIELISRIPELDPATIVDLGCGTGHLTSILTARWPAARVEGIDNSVEMIDRARSDHPGIQWTLRDVARWQPEAPVDIIFSNAALHWVDDHRTLFPHLLAHIAPGGVLAVQMPDNWTAPTHTTAATILDTGDWPPGARKALIRDRVADPRQYRSWLLPARIDMWRTTYYQEIQGQDAVWEWVTGSLLRPVLASLDGTDLQRFVAECRRAYRTAYPPETDGTTVLEFSRLFLVAQKQ